MIAGIAQFTSDNGTPRRASVPVWRQFALIAITAVLAACSTAPRTPVAPQAVPASIPDSAAPAPANRLPVLPAAGSGRGGYYQDDGPGDHPPEGLMDIPDPMPKVEPYAATGNKPYVVFGKTYTPIVDQRPFKQRGTGSWYGKKFHGQKTSSGELYDMYKLTAAHPTLPIPSYARVTNMSNGAQVIVRINDRGPFHSSRIIDLSYTAALKLGYLGKGSSELEVERLLPDDIARINAARQQPAVVAESPAATTKVIVAPPVDDVQVMQQAELDALVAERLAASERTNSAIAGSFYLQFGAYGEADNAEAARARLMQSWDSSLPPMEVIHADTFYRLHCGPFASRDEAVQAAQKVQVSGDVRAVIVQR